MTTRITAQAHHADRAAAYAWTIAPVSVSGVHFRYSRNGVSILVRYSYAGHVLTAVRTDGTTRVAAEGRGKRETVISWLVVRPGNEYRWDSKSGRFVLDAPAAPAITGQVAELRRLATDAGLVVTAGRVEDTRDARYASDYYTDATGSLRLEVRWGTYSNGTDTYVSELLNRKRVSGYSHNDGWFQYSMRTSAYPNNFEHAVDTIAELGALVSDIAAAHARAIELDAVEVEPATVTDLHVAGRCKGYDNTGNPATSVIGAHCHCTLETYYLNTGETMSCSVCEPDAYAQDQLAASVALSMFDDSDVYPFVSDAEVLQAEAERTQANTRGIPVTALATATRASIADWITRDASAVQEYVDAAATSAAMEDAMHAAGIRLGAWIAAQARNVQETAGVYPEFVSDAPSTYAELLQATARWQYELGAAYLPVWNGASENTIYPDAVTNMLFRFWHDYGHISHHLGFVQAEETELQTTHHLPLVAAEFGTDSLEYRMYYADTVGAIEYNNENGVFPDNQFKFVKGYLQSPRLALNTSY